MDYFTYMTTHFTFFINTTKDHLKDVYDYIFNNKEKYMIEKFIVSYEEITSKGKKPHIHFYGVFNIETLDYTHKIAKNLCKVFVDKYNLRKSQKGGTVNYGVGKKDGKLKKTPEQTMTYHTKEKQYFYFGWPDEYVKSCEAKSFIKEKENKLDYVKLLKDNSLQYFEEHFNTGITIYRSHFSCYDNKNEMYMTPIKPSSPDIFGEVYYSPKDLTHKIKKFIYFFIRDKTDTNLKSITMIKSISFYVVNKTTLIDDDIRFEILENI